MSMSIDMDGMRPRSPLPLLMVLQLNIAEASSESDFKDMLRLKLCVPPSFICMLVVFF